MKPTTYLASNQTSESLLCELSNQNTSKRSVTNSSALNSNRLSFKQCIERLIDGGVDNVDDISTVDARILIATYLKEINAITRWEFITEPEGSNRLPELLIQLLEANDEKSMNHLALSLSFTMAQSALEYGMPIIEEALEIAVGNRLSNEEQ